MLEISLKWRICEIWIFRYSSCWISKSDVGLAREELRSSTHITNVLKYWMAMLLQPSSGAQIYWSITFYNLCQICRTYTHTLTAVLVRFVFQKATGTSPVGKINYDVHLKSWFEVSYAVRLCHFNAVQLSSPSAPHNACVHKTHRSLMRFFDSEFWLRRLSTCAHLTPNARYPCCNWIGLVAKENCVGATWVKLSPCCIRAWMTFTFFFLSPLPRWLLSNREPRSI